MIPTHTCKSTINLELGELPKMYLINKGIDVKTTIIKLTRINILNNLSLFLFDFFCSILNTKNN